MVWNFIKPVVSVMEMELPWADYPLLLYRPPGITFDVWEQNKKPRSYYASGAFSSFFLPILRIVYFYMGEEGWRVGEEIKKTLHLPKPR